MTALTHPEATRYEIKKLRKLNILLVEDDLLNAKLVSILFEQHGIKLQFAENGKKAVEKIKTAHFDMVLMDMEMPVMNGYEAVSVIRQQLKNHVPIIALTAHALPGEKQKCLLLGMNAYISKPLDADILLNTIYALTFRNKTTLAASNAIRLHKFVKVSDKVCDMGYLIGATGGNKKIMHNIVAVFFKETRKELYALNNAIKKSNYTVISDLSHKIKSAFSILGISVLDPVFNEMEQLSSRTSPIGEIAKLNYRVNTVFIQAREEMKKKR